MRLFIDSWRWEGVPWYLRSGKNLAQSVNEVVVELKPPPQKLFDDSPAASGQTNYLRFQLAPHSTIGLAARVKQKGRKFIGDQKELFLIEEEPGEQSPYERLLGDAISGDRTLFTREDASEAAWAVVDPVLKKHPRSLPYRRGSWGPKAANALMATDGDWHNPVLGSKKAR